MRLHDWFVLYPLDSDLGVETMVDMSYIEMDYVELRIAACCI
jgi:hypothetical protein